MLIGERPHDAGLCPKGAKEFAVCRAIIIIGHGSRSPEANAQLLAVVDQLKLSYADDQVLAAYMEMVSPSLSEAMTTAVAKGACTILVIPCLLFQGMHVHADIPQLIQTFASTHPGITVRMGRAIGADPLLTAILHARIEEIA